MAGGVIVMGLLFPNKGPGGSRELLPEPVLYTLRCFSHFGFALHSFMLGVETNMTSALRRIGKKSITICFTGFSCSVILSLLSYSLLHGVLPPDFSHSGSLRLIILHQSLNFFGVTCTNVNNVGISNSELGRLASAIALIIDVFSMFATFIIFNLILALKAGDFLQPILVLGENFLLFVLLRPILIRIISYTPEGQAMSQSSFMAVIIVILIATLAGTLVDQYFSVYLFALSIPEEPLSSILAEKLDIMTSGILFPIFCAVHGFQTNFGYLHDFETSIAIELIILSGHLGKFIGTFLSSRMFSIPLRSAIALAIIITSKGYFDITILCQWSMSEILSVHAYTLASLHIFVTTFGLLPLVRRLYEPSKRYSTIFRQNVLASREGGTLQTLFCIYNEENVPGFIHFLEALHPSRINPIPVVTIQLIQLTGRCSLPIMAPWDQVKSYAALRSNVARCNRVVNAFTNRERKFKGYIRVQNYVSVSSYATMHNDICNLAFEKNVSLLILPFHVLWTAEGTIDHTSQSIREVNKMVLEKAPCSVALFVNRGSKDLIQLQLHASNPGVYRIIMLFLGGPDDQEALAISHCFANHPFISLTLLWVKSDNNKAKDKTSRDYQVVERCLDENGLKTDYKEVICNDGSETTAVLKSLNEEVDLLVVGKHHGADCVPLYGLDGEWKEYPELGVLPDLLLTANFNFSILVVQQEPQHGLPVYDDD
ncbi:cation/H(+) antiporter 14-like [Silene latifolia]|uniref:cation/H(+) antiporter 14-like n=1 Tax=Silene latifolia TaxID=37657 RepID=UPI003D77606E